MPAQLRFLLLLPCLFGGLFLSTPLCAVAQSPLPTPTRPQTNNNNATLDGLGSMFGTNRPANASVSHPDVNNTAAPIQNAQYQEPAFAELSAPNKLKQASATFSSPTPSLSSRSDSSRSGNPFYEDNADDRHYEYDDYDYDYEAENRYAQEYIDAPDATLDRELFSRRSNNEFDEEGDEESGLGGWTNKLVKPTLTPLFSVGGSLLIVLSAFFLLVILFRKVSPQSSRPLPKEAFECLGRYYLTQKHQVQILRLGNRVVLVSVMPDGVTTLAEITDPDETVAFLGLCRRLDNNSATEMFRKTIASMSDEELHQPLQRDSRRHSAGSSRRPQPQQRAGSLDLYSDPDESLASLLARGRAYGR